MQNTSNDKRVASVQSLLKPQDLIDEMPLSETVENWINQSRSSASKIIQGQDDRLLIIVGPCSIHDYESTLEYAHHLKQASEDYCDDMHVIMRVYFEKPRTMLGWKGLISDPTLDSRHDINKGLRQARLLLMKIAEMQLASATEFLDTVIPQYISDLISWSAIGARTAESQIHRELASGLSMPVGFKNSTEGNIKIAVDAVSTARHAHHFLGIAKDGTPSNIGTVGNEDCHIILRGSNTGTNYSEKYIKEAANLLLEANLPTRVMIDCSHGNSMKNYQLQSHVVESMAQQISQGSNTICGVMIESHLFAGKQDLIPGLPLVYGKSITDACISWDETKELLKKLSLAVKARRLIKVPKIKS